MKRLQILLAGALLVIASLACNALSRSGSGSNPSTTQAPVQPTEAPDNSNSNASGNGNQNVKTDFPLTPDASNITDLGDGSILFYTKLSLADIMKFYRDAYTAKGYK